MTAYTDKLIEAMGFRGGPRGSLVAALKFMIEHGPSEGMLKSVDDESLDQYLARDRGVIVLTEMCRALLTELGDHEHARP